MSLSDYEFKPLYNSLKDDVISTFYEPALSCCTIYRRASAYFDANILSLYSRGIEQIVQSNGHIEFVFSCDLSEEDYEAMMEGYDLRKQLERNLICKLDVPSPNDELKNLAYLIAKGYVDIKVAFTSTGIFHDKFGLIYDNDGNCLCFRGSNNETSASAEANSESFDTTCSWDASSRDLEKIRSTEEQFSDLWNNTFPKTIVLDLPQVVRNRILDYGDGKLHLKPKSLVNTILITIDSNQHLVIENNLFSPESFSDTEYFELYISPYVEEIAGRHIKFATDIGVYDIKQIISSVQEMSEAWHFDYVVSNELKQFLDAYNLKMANLCALGVAIKRKSDFLQKDFEEFAKTVNSLVTRPLVEPQLWSAYQIVKMKRAANFSVPGAGKTAIVLGAFAFLRHIGAVDKIVAIGPLNSFISWKNEFKAVFGDKLPLNVFDYQADKLLSPTKKRFDAIIRSGDCNLCLFNYESLPTIRLPLQRLVNAKALLVFDEVHRIKSVGGVRASSALAIAGNFGAQYRVVMTGTPIPNGFQDAYNFLNILFGQSYDDYFELAGRDLAKCNKDLYAQEEFNNKIFPFFSVINKEQLKVPPADPDDWETGYCLAGEREEKLFEIVRLRTLGCTLLTYIRLMEASSNPSLILHNASKAAEDIFTDSGDFDYESGDEPEIPEDGEFDGFVEEYTDEEREFIANFGMTEKFYRGVDIVENEVAAGNHVLCWAIFIDTLYKIKGALAEKGIRSAVICGTVPLQERESIIADFQAGRLDVLIANPATLAESVSLHKNCHVAVYFEYSFDLVHLLQSKDRIHRFGLPPGTRTHYYYMMEDNPEAEYQCIDKLILERLKTKADRQNEFLNNEGLAYEGEDLLQEIGDIVQFRQ